MKKLNVLTRMLLLVALLVGSVSNAWGDTTVNTNFTGVSSGKVIQTGDVTTWSFTGTSPGSWNNDYEGVQFGTKNSAPSVTITYTTSETVKSVSIKASTGGAATLSVKVGDTDFSPASTSISSGTSNAGRTYTFTGSATGEIKVTLKGTSKASYLGGISFTYSEDDTDYTITIDSENISNGSVAASASSAKAGTEITLTPTPNSGYALSTWYVVDDSDNAVTVTNNKFTMPSSNVTVGATFSQLRAIIVNDAEHGSITASPTSAYDGQTVTLTATPDANYELFGVTVTNTSTSAAVATSGTGNERTFTMPDAPVSVTPIFTLQKGIESNPYTVTEVLAYITGGGTGNKYTRGIVSEISSLNTNTLTYYISDDGTTTNQMMVYKGKNLENTDFAATTDLKVGDRVVVYGPVAYYNNTTPEYTTGNYIYSISRDFTFYLDDISNGSVGIQVNGVSQVPNVDGEVTIASGATVTLTATPASGYTFANWTCNDATYNNSTTNPLEFEMPFGDILFGTSFLDANAKYDIIVDDAINGGTISADVNQAKAGDKVTLTATPSTNYVFSAWDVQDENSVAVDVTNDQFTMPASDVIVTATFKKVHTITYYIDGVENSITRVDGEELKIPVSASGFAGWTDDDSDVTPSISNDDVVTGDMKLYAVFVKGKVTNYQLVEADQADWRGDYLIAYSNTIFADGRVGGTDGMGKQNTKANPGEKLSGNVVDVDWGDTYKVTFEAKDDADLSKGYVLKTQDGNYNYQTSNSNGLATSKNKATAATYAFSVTFTSSSDIKLNLSGAAAGAVFRYNTGGYFRFYKDGGQSPVYLYKRTENATYSLNEYEAVTITSAGRATFSSTNALDFTGADVEAYIAKSTDGSSVTFTSVNVVPANTGLLVKGDKGTYYIPVTTASTDDVSANKMQSTASAAHNVTSEEYGKAFVFGKKGDEIGFFKAAIGKTIAQCKSYLLFDVAPAKDVEFIDIIYNNETEEQGETTSISDELRAKSEDSAAYNLAGQKVGKDYKGIVVINGHKVIRK